MKRHHRILGNKKMRVLCLESQLYFLSKKEMRIGNAVAHLHKVFYCQVSDCVSIDLALLFEVSEHTLPIWPVSIQEAQQASAVFKSTIYALSKERNNRMRGVAQQQTSA